jgi:peptide/nickel transport system ATP-binding protein
MQTRSQQQRHQDRDAQVAARGADGVVLSVRGLSVEYRARRGGVKAVRNVDFDLYKGESLALIGESGCGKTTLATALVRLLVRMATISEGEVLYHRDGKTVDVLALNEGGMRHFRWKECAMVFQGALNAFNPVLTIARQFQDTAQAHGLNDKAEIDRRSRDLLRKVQLDPDRVLPSYPFELSGGMRQRVLMALALLLEPQVIILDEPTTALDILTQRNIIDMLNGLRKELGFTLLFVSHDLAMAAELADRVATMYAGRIIELGDVYDIFNAPRHPYTYGLMKATPTLHDDASEMV